MKKNNYNVRDTAFYDFKEYCRIHKLNSSHEEVLRGFLEKIKIYNPTFNKDDGLERVKI